MEAILKTALTLSAKERAQLADELWRSVPPDESSLALTPAQKQDLQRRLAEDAAGKSDPRDWAEARAELRRQG